MMFFSNERKEACQRCPFASQCGVTTAAHYVWKWVRKGFGIDESTQDEILERLVKLRCCVMDPVAFCSSVRCGSASDTNCLGCDSV